MPHALQFLVPTLAGWLNRHQEDLINYLREENRVLREQLGSKPLRLTDQQRRRLAIRGKRLGRRTLTQVASIVTPDTILRWYRRLIAKKYDGTAHRGRGRPTTPKQIADLVVRMAGENPRWGYTRIRDALSIKEECLTRVFVHGENHLRLVIDEYVEHYHRERNHQGLGNQLLERAPPSANPKTEVQRRERVGGLLNYYHREAT